MCVCVCVCVCVCPLRYFGRTESLSPVYNNQQHIYFNVCFEHLPA